MEEHILTAKSTWRHSTSLAIRDMPPKAQWLWPHTTSVWTQMETGVTTPSAGKGARNRITHTAGESVKRHSHSGRHPGTCFKHYTLTPVEADESQWFLWLTDLHSAGFLVRDRQPHIQPHAVSGAIKWCHWELAKHYLTLGKATCCRKLGWWTWWVNRKAYDYTS